MQVGVTASALQWISSFLASISHSIKLSGCSSKICSALVGVPQGSIFGPLECALMPGNFLHTDSIVMARQPFLSWVKKPGPSDRSHILNVEQSNKMSGGFGITWFTLILVGGLYLSNFRLLELT